MYFAKNVAYVPFNSWLSFQRLCRLLWGWLSAPSGRNIRPLFPYHLDTPLSFILLRPCIWYAVHGRGEANKRSTDSKHGATGDNYPAHNKPIFGRPLVSILRSREIPFPGLRKKMETRDSQVSLTSLLWMMSTAVSVEWNGR